MTQEEVRQMVTKFAKQRGIVPSDSSNSKPSEDTRCCNCGKLGALYTLGPIHQLQSGNVYRCVYCGFTV